MPHTQVPWRVPTHPTKEKLITTVVEMLQEGPAEGRIEEILKRSGVSTGSLYHHFEDLEDLIECAYARRFAMFVDVSIGLLANVSETVTSREEMLAGLFEVTRLTQSSALKPIRYERARIVSMAQHNERFASALRVEQQRLTDAIEDLIRNAQEHEWMNKDFDPRVGAVMIQAYTLGKVVDDVSEEPMDPEAWDRLVNMIIEKVFS